MVNIFQIGAKPFKVLITNFISNLHYLLNENQLTNIEYWSVWDSILGIQQNTGIPLGIDDLNLPNDVELVYSKYAVSVYHNQQYFAEIRPNPTGFVEEVKFFNENGTVRQIDTYDDRGFEIRSQTYTPENKISTTKWYNEAGKTVVQYDADELEPVSILAEQQRFNKQKYASVAELTTEFLERLLKKDFKKRQDAIVANPVVNLNSIQKEFPVSYMMDNQRRITPELIEEFENKIRNARAFYVDNPYSVHKIHQEIKAGLAAKIKLGYPYGTRLKLGNSNEEPNSIVYWNIGKDTLLDDINRFGPVIEEYLFSNSEVSLIVRTNEDYQKQKIAERLTRRIVKKFSFLSDDDFSLIEQILTSSKEREKMIGKLVSQIRDRFSVSIDGDSTFNASDDQLINWDELLRVLSQFEVKNRPIETVIQKDLNRIRVLIDIGTPYDTLMQFNAISFGVPQITVLESPLIKNRNNGWIVQKNQTLTDGLDYFLKKLADWNRSLVATVGYINQYAEANQADWWEEVLMNGERN